MNRYILIGLQVAIIAVFSWRCGLMTFLLLPLLILHRYECRMDYTKGGPR